MPSCEVCGPDGAVDQLWPEGPGPALADDPRTCPTCGRELRPPVKAPWHFKLMVVSLVIYLGWRGWQGIAWVLDRL